MIHVLIGDGEDDYARLLTAPKTGGALSDWVVPKDAQPGDSVFFFVRRYGFVSRGEVASSPGPGYFGNKPCYRADIKRIHRIDPHVPYEHIQRSLPHWAWATYPRGLTTPDTTTADELEQVIEAYEENAAKRSQR
jgi:hypothetical protein